MPICCRRCSRSALAAWLSFRYLGKLIDKMVPVSAGLLLATAVTHLLPEAFNSDADPFTLGWAILVGILGFFLLEKLALIHHTHHHEGDHAPARSRTRRA